MKELSLNRVSCVWCSCRGLWGDLWGVDLQAHGPESGSRHLPAPLPWGHQRLPSPATDQRWQPEQQQALLSSPAGTDRPEVGKKETISCHRLHHSSVSYCRLVHGLGRPTARSIQYHSMFFNSISENNQWMWPFTFFFQNNLLLPFRPQLMEALYFTLLFSAILTHSNRGLYWAVFLLQGYINQKHHTSLPNVSFTQMTFCKMISDKIFCYLCDVTVSVFKPSHHWGVNWSLIKYP